MYNQNDVAIRIVIFTFGYKTIKTNKVTKNHYLIRLNNTVYKCSIKLSFTKQNVNISLKYDLVLWCYGNEIPIFLKTKLLETKLILSFSLSF